MKLYNKLRNLKKSTKAGLVGSAIYAASSLALPVFADVAKEDLSSLSASQLKTQYEAELHSVLKDGKIYSPEVEKLDTILGHYLKAKEKENVHPKIIVKDTEDNKKNIVSNDSLDAIVNDFKKKLLFHYPNLFLRESSIKYDAFKKLPEGEILKDLIERTYNILGDVKTEKENLEVLLNKDYYEIKDLRELYKNDLTQLRKIKFWVK